MDIWLSISFFIVLFGFEEQFPFWIITE